MSAAASAAAKGKRKSTTNASTIQSKQAKTNPISWKQAGCDFLEIKLTTDGALRYFNLEDVEPGNGDNDIKTLLTFIGKWVTAGTVNRNIGKLLSNSFTRMLQLAGAQKQIATDKPIIENGQPITISSTQLLTLTVELEDRLVHTLNADDWEQIGYTEVMRKAFGDSVGGMNVSKEKNIPKIKAAAQKRLATHTGILAKLQSQLAKLQSQLQNAKNIQREQQLLEKIQEIRQQISERRLRVAEDEIVAEHGYGFTPASVRETILAPVPNQIQCSSVIGKYEDTDICYLCGLPFNIANPIQVDCEHVLGILLAGMYINLVQGGARIFKQEPENYKEIMKLEYLWAHHCCNIVKLDEPFIKKEQLQNGAYEYVIHEENINKMIAGIKAKANAVEQNQIGCQDIFGAGNTQITRFTTLDENKEKIMEHMKNLCDFINGQINGIKEIVGPEEGVDPDLMASQIFEAFIKFRFFGRIQNSLVVKGLVNAASHFNYKTGLLEPIWPKDKKNQGENNQGSHSEGGRRLRKQNGGGISINDFFDISLILFLNLFTEDEFSFILKGIYAICSLQLKSEDKINLITNLFLIILSSKRPTIIDRLDLDRLNIIPLDDILSEEDIRQAQQRPMSHIAQHVTYTNARDLIIQQLQSAEVEEARRVAGIGYFTKQNLQASPYTFGSQASQSTFGSQDYFPPSSPTYATNSSASSRLGSPGSSPYRVASFVRSTNRSSPVGRMVTLTPPLSPKPAAASSANALNANAYTMGQGGASKKRSTRRIHRKLHTKNKRLSKRYRQHTKKRNHKQNKKTRRHK